MWHVHGNRVSKAQCTTKIRNKTQRRISVHQRRKKKKTKKKQNLEKNFYSSEKKKKKKKTKEESLFLREERKKKKKPQKQKQDPGTRQHGSRCDLGLRGGLGLHLSCISLSSSSLSFFSFFSDEQIFFFGFCFLF